MWIFQVTLEGNDPIRSQSVLYKREIFEIHKRLEKPHSCADNDVLSKLAIKCAENYFKEN